MSEQPQNIASLSPQIRLGGLLREHRLAKNTEIPALARTLILSAAQITAIETGSQASFHNQSFYLRALKKYLTHMNLALDPEASVLFTEIESKLLTASTKMGPNDVSQLVHAGLSNRPKSYLPHLNIKKNYLFAALLALMIATGLTVAMMKRGSDNLPRQEAAAIVMTDTSLNAHAASSESGSQETQKPSAPSSATTGAFVQTEAGKITETNSAIDKDSATHASPVATTLKFIFSAPSWIQAVEKNGKRTERVFTSKDALELDSAKLVSLVIGNARETQLFSNATKIDLSKYLNASSGVARFSESDLVKLGQ